MPHSTFNLHPACLNYPDLGMMKCWTTQHLPHENLTIQYTPHSPAARFQHHHPHIPHSGAACHHWHKFEAKQHQSGNMELGHIICESYKVN
ncbi:topoisomerase i [Moniliophthora roreri]|nr:topoisomerase i [Moniliophthora roreri]